MTEPVSVPLSAAEIVLLTRLVVEAIPRTQVDEVRYALRRLLEKLDHA